MPYAAIRRAHTLLTCCKSLLVVSRDRPSCTNIASASAQRVDSNTFVRVCRKFRFFTFEVSYLVLDKFSDPCSTHQACFCQRRKLSVLVSWKIFL